MLFTSHYESPIGGITIASDGENIIGLWFDGQKYFGDTLGADNAEAKALGEASIEDLTSLPVFEKTQGANNEKVCLPVFELTHKWLDLYFSGQIPDFTPHIKLLGSDFRKKVWSILLEIPYGNTMSYGEIAHRISPRMSAQAIGAAVGHNPISLIVPCHRVVGSNGSLTGYAGGLDKKLWLLDLERRT